MGSDASTLPVPPGALFPAPPTLRARRRVRDRIGERGLGAIGGFALVGLVVLSLGLVMAAAERQSFLTPTSHAAFPRWLSGPLTGAWPALTTHRDTLKWAFSLTVAAMYLCYLLALLCAPRLRARWTIAAVVLLHLIFFLSPPLSLTDVFNYINYGRMGYVHHLNPYTTIPALEPHTDPSYHLSNWHHLLSPYGPLFTLFTYALAPLGVATGFWMLKLSLMLASLAVLGLVWACARRLDRNPLPALLFVGLNPLVLVWGLGGDHNDFLMILGIMLGFYLLLSARVGDRGAGAASANANGAGPVAHEAAWPTGSVPALNSTRAGAPVYRTSPFSPAPVTPGALVPSATRGWPSASPGGLAGSGAGAGQGQLYLPNGAGPPAGAESGRGPSGGFAPPARGWRRRLGGGREIGAGAALVGALAIKASAGILLPVMLCGTARGRWRLLAGMVLGGVVLAAATLIAFGLHLPDLAQQSRLVTGVGLPNLLGYSLGLGGETQGLHDLLSAVLAVSVGACCVWAWRSQEWLRPAGVAMLVLLLTLSWELPWYVYWLLPLAALSRSRGLRGATLVLGVYLILAWIPLMTDLIHGLNFRPTATPLGEEHTRLTKRLLH